MKINEQLFQQYSINNGTLKDLKEDSFPSSLISWSDSLCSLHEKGTHFIYVFSGTAKLSHASGHFNLSVGMYVAAPGKATLEGQGQGIVITRWNYQGFFQVGGPIESVGRLNYIDGCTDSLLIPPIIKGDPCLNLLHIPAETHQTQHTHPSMRIGIIVRGCGRCITPDADIVLKPGLVFIIPTNCVHSFHTDNDDLLVIAYHPDSDYGPTHQFHPMVNRTMVDGVSASFIREIQTVK